MVVACDTDLDILVVATLTAEPCVNRPSPTKPPRAGEGAQKAANGKKFVTRAGGEVHWLLILRSATGHTMAFK